MAACLLQKQQKPRKPKIFTIWPFIEKCLLTFGFNYYVRVVPRFSSHLFPTMKRKFKRGQKVTIEGTKGNIQILAPTYFSPLR